MTSTTLDGLTLTVVSWGEDATATNSQWDGWVSGAYQRLLRVFGIVRTYAIVCVEQDAAWASSQAKHFQDAAEAGAEVTLFSDMPIRPVNNVGVYVLGVSYTLEQVGTQNIRKITLNLQEAHIVPLVGPVSPPPAGTTITCALGSATITAGNTSVIVPHSLGATPSAIIIFTTGDLGGLNGWAPNSERTTTQFTIHIGSPLLEDVTFNYIALP